MKRGVLIGAVGLLIVMAVGFVSMVFSVIVEAISNG